MGFSEKQLKIMKWPYTGKNALICDGAVRSGKTSVMSLSFVLWAMGKFSGCSFGVCGKTGSASYAGNPGTTSAGGTGGYGGGGAGGYGTALAANGTSGGGGGGAGGCVALSW